ncbi:MAG: hypothetical protein EXQ70_11055 [Solirubrobacterales bacterium]|nr:hypothetical protein [Solirubrobacterales bacterium]
MGFLDRFRSAEREFTEPHPDGVAELIVGDAAYDDWEVVRDFEELETARAWRQQLTDQGFEAVLTADHPISNRGYGDIALRVPKGKWSEANEALDEPT